MSLLKTLKGQILLVSIGCLVAWLLALTVANYLTARSQAYASLTAQSQALAHSHIETFDTVRARLRGESARPHSKMRGCQIAAHLAKAATS